MDLAAGSGCGVSALDLSRFFRKQSIDQFEEDARSSPLKRALGRTDLIALGIGGIIGSAIYGLLGPAIVGNGLPGAGPAIILSLFLTATACVFCGLCYTEFASLIPIGGSAYTYSYATLGELVAWIIGWDLLLEYAISNSVVAIVWATNFHALCSGLGIDIPAWAAVDYRSAVQAASLTRSTSAAQALAREAWLTAPTVFGIPVIFNFLAASIMVLITWLLFIGVKETAATNDVIVAIKLGTLFFFIVVGFRFVKPENWSPFMPNGWSGVWAGASMMFFAFIGFDAVSTAAEECKNPRRDMLFGIMGSLAVCTVIYVVVAAVLTGMVPWEELKEGNPNPMVEAMKSFVGSSFAAWIISFGAVITMTATILVFQYGQLRIFYSMSRDGLLSPFFKKVHPKYHTPHIVTIVTGACVALIAGTWNIEEIANLTIFGTLFALALVCAGVIILRYVDPNRLRPFKTPLVPLIPLLGIISCIVLMRGLPSDAWKRFGVWLLVGLGIYFSYGFRKSRLRHTPQQTSLPPDQSEIPRA